VVATTETLIGCARESTALENLGSDGWQAGLDHLVAAVERDVEDNDAVARIEALIVGRLTTRLRIEAWFAEHGPDAVAPVEGPLVIVGLPRTATTALQYLLAVDPQFRYLRSWEVNDPVPPPRLESEHDDPRRPSEPPSVDVRHIASIDGPAEDWPIHALAFDHAELSLPVPSHSVWWRTTDHASLFAYHDRVLRLLHAYRSPRHWLLKMPAYLFLLPQLAAHYPDARFVMTHRDPVAAIASTCSTVADARHKRTPSWRPEPEFGDRLLAHWTAGMECAVHARNALGEDRFIDVAQHELQADPTGVAQRVYDFAGLTLEGDVRAEMARWAANNERGSRGEHRYCPEDFGLTAAQIEAAFTPYLGRFADRCL
jgi:hypothetical protein